jgi:hypothetical protein
VAFPARVAGCWRAVAMRCGPSPVAVGEEGEGRLCSSVYILQRTNGSMPKYSVLRPNNKMRPNNMRPNNGSGPVCEWSNKPVDCTSVLNDNVAM